ncbi:CLUMA_CG003096, isoform A [Clunio marinus]|uniref:CLUMA_CG003096, isoform A n=1 Tax=Clunio marinus TaxID=568069 RepID=A0A1J1HT17_9DIPT|nr:CLUMA_CG003096, isoform A [Clunio marinus]
MANSDWRQTILDRLRERNKCEGGFHEVILHNHRILERSHQLKSENLTLSVENEKLRSGLGFGDSASAARVQALEKKLLDKQEELTDMHKRKGDNQQMIIDLNIKVSELQKQLELKNNSLTDQIKNNHSLKAEVQMLTNSIHELKELNTTLRDEHTALHLLHCSLEEKLRKTQTENSQLVERVMKFKAKDAEKMNEENETFLRFGSLFSRKKNDAMKRELAEAARESSVRRSSSPVSINERDDMFQGTLTGAGNVYFGDEIPNKVHINFDAHDGEVNAVRWSPVDRIVATGGSDRKVKLWDVGKGNSFESRGTLVGSNQAVNSLDFDSTGTLILGTSNDFASRVWSISDHRLRS